MDALLRRRLMMQLGGEPPVPIFYSHLSFDGQAGIQTDILVPANGTISFRSIGWEKTKPGERYIFFVARTDSSSQGYCSFWYGLSTSTTSRKINVTYDSTSQVNENKTLGYTYESYGFALTPKRVLIGNSSQTFNKGSLTHPGGGIYIGGISDTSTIGRFDGETGILMVYGSDAQNATTCDGLLSYTPVATLRPCLYGSKAGYWCVETGQFYGNTRSEGTLTVAGNIQTT